MEQAATDAGHQRDQEASRKRQSISDHLSNSAKRRRLDPDVDTVAALVDAGTRRGRDNALATFDVTTLPLQLAVDLIIASFQALGPETLAQAITVRGTVFLTVDIRSDTASSSQDARRNLPDSEATALPPVAVAPIVAAPVPTYAQVKSEPLDPLQLDLGDEELDLKAVMPPIDASVSSLIPLMSVVASLLRGKRRWTKKLTMPDLKASDSNSTWPTSAPTLLLLSSFPPLQKPL